MSFDHILLHCPVDLLSAFMNAALAPLGIKEQFRVVPEVIAFGNDQDKRFFWVSGLDRNQQPVKPDTPSGVHLAFKAQDQAQIDAFHKAALEAGGKDNGAPEVRKHYHPGYYAAFVISPGGSNVEACNHDFSK